MDLWTLMTISALLLVTAAAATPTPTVSPANTVPTQTNSTTTQTNSTTTQTSTVCSCPSNTQTATTAISFLSTTSCPVRPDVAGQLHAYKVVTALLSCVLLVILLIRFTRPTVEALQRRFSDRRQNRWIGPTQSHSVSYHRGKTVKNDEREKRLSYPALERLAVSDSREPSSTRNSGCNY